MIATGQRDSLASVAAVDPISLPAIAPIPIDPGQIIVAFRDSSISTVFTVPQRTSVSILTCVPVASTAEVAARTDASA